MIIYNAIAILYLFSGIWCALQPLKSMGYLGYQDLGSSTVAEFITVYGGLQIGIALAMLGVNWLPQYFAGTLFFATVLSLCLIVMRVLSMVAHGWFSAGIAMGILELVIAVALGILFYRHHTAA